MAAYYTFEDYSGSSAPQKGDNPYDGLLETCNNDPVQLQLLHTQHQLCIWSIH